MTTLETVRWGILGAANIARKYVLPAMARCTAAEVLAIASRHPIRAMDAANAAGVQRAYGSYEELVADPDIEVVYNALPNHLHVPWTARAAEAGKHVLCEKPIALDAQQASELLGVRQRTGVLIGEAFMVRSHPRWLEVRRFVREGRIGRLRLVTGHFSYYKTDPQDIRNQLAYGGGGLLDIGCYPVNLSRFLFGEEPVRALASLERDPEMRVDRLTSGLLEFPSGQCAFTCGTQIAPAQHMRICGTAGLIEIDMPFTPPPDRASHIVIEGGKDTASDAREIIEFPPCDQYTLQADTFSLAVRGLDVVPVPLEDAIHNMAVLDALFRSERSGMWESPTYTSALLRFS